MSFRFTAALAAAVAASSVQAAPGPNWILATGVVKAGTLDSGIGNYTFTSQSPVGSKIFALCKMDDLCEAQVRTNAKGVVVSVGRVRKVEPFTTPNTLLDFIYSHYTDISSPGFNPDEDTAPRIYAPALAELVDSANIKAGQEQEESPAVSPWLNGQEWKVENVKAVVVDLGPGKARADVTLTNEGIADAYSFVMVKGDAGWLIADVTPTGPSSRGIPPLTALLKDYTKPSSESSEALSAQKGRTVMADASTGDLSRTSLDRESLCRTDEEAIFSCAVRKRIASLCASRDLGPGKGTMTYRFGKAGAIELAYPEPGVAPSKAFTAAVVERGDYVRFVRNGTSYKLYSLVPQGQSPFGGIMISENGRRVADLRCDGGADGLGIDNWSVMYKAKLPEDSDRSLDP